MTAPLSDSNPTGRLPRVSILISTYAAEKPSNLAASLASLRAQTIPPHQIVLVIDGPIDREQETVIQNFLAEASETSRISVLHLPENGGLANAMNEGLALCTGSYTMRMDSDDLCTADRVAVQLAYLAANPQTDVLSAWGEEFFEDGSPSNLKASPTTHGAVIKALRWRNILVHPTVCIRTSLLRQAGGYRSRFGLMEDYDLFLRLVQAGAHFHVIPRVLLRIRCGLEQRRRRGGLHYALDEIRFRREFYRAGFYTFREFVLISGLYGLFRLVSGGMRDRLYALARSRNVGRSAGTAIEVKVPNHPPPARG